MAEIVELEFIPVSVPYTRTEVSTLVTWSGVTDVLVKATDNNGRIGWGESASGANVESVLEALKAMSHRDLFATLPEAAEATPDAATARGINSPGRSHLAHLRGTPVAGWKDDVICEYGNARMARRGEYKLILRYPYNGSQFANEFYDLRADPRETVNLYSSPTEEQSQAIAEMTRNINEFFASYTVPGHSGLDMQDQPVATDDSPWLRQHFTTRNS